MRGIYQHCAKTHLHRYLAEFDFRNNRRVAIGAYDKTHANCILSGIAGKCLTYRRIGEAANAKAKGKKTPAQTSVG